MFGNYSDQSTDRLDLVDPLGYLQDGWAGSASLRLSCHQKYRKGRLLCQTLVSFPRRYCIGENGAGIRSLVRCRMMGAEFGGGHTPLSRVSARILMRSSKLG